MGKILCSREPWDSILGHNRPNGTSRTWNFEESQEQPSILNTITDEFVDDYIKNPRNFNKTHYSLTFHEDFEDVEIHDIGDNKHIYIIRIFHHNYFRRNLNTGFSCISKLVLEDVKKGKCALIVECTTEGKYLHNPNTEFDIIERWRIKEELPEYSVTVISGNLICKEYIERNNLKINAYGVSSFENFFTPPEEYTQNVDKVVPFDAYSNKVNKYFLSYNRQPRFHRLLFGYLLDQAKILKKGLVSLRFPDHKGLNFKPGTFYGHKIASNKKYERFKQKGNITIDVPTDQNLAQNFMISNYEDTFVSVVSETLMDTGCLFFSEKIWKPISVGHPFIIMGNPHSLKKLQEMGYITFSEVWDESYDNIISEGDRVVAVTKVLQSICSMSDKELEDARKHMDAIVKHNKKVFHDTLTNDFKCRPDQFGTALPIVDIVKEIYNNLGYKPHK